MAKLSQIKLGSTTYDIGAAWGNISGKPSSFPPSDHTHNYLPLSGGTLTGKLIFQNGIIDSTSPTEQNIVINGTQNDSTVSKAPGIGFHIGGLNWGSLKFQSDGSFRFYNNECTAYKPVYASTFYGSLEGNASTATKLATARTISLTGSVTGSGTFDGSGNLSIATTTNHSHNYLPLSGGTMTGDIHFTNKGLTYAPGNTNQYLWKVYSTAEGQYGFRLQYDGSEAGNNNSLSLYADNQTGTEVRAVRIFQDGTITCAKNITAPTFIGSLNGNAATATNATTATNVAWSGITSKPSYYDAKAIKSITRDGTTFTYTCLDGTTGTFTQQDNNTDTKVSQSRSTTANYRSLLLHHTVSTAYGTNPGAATDKVYYHETIAACPSTGDIRATSFTGALKGNADTATKLATARTISLTGSVTGSGSFDGSGNLNIATTTNHSHNYAGSSSAGGSATSAVKLDTATAGDANTPVYFNGGKPVACTSLDLNTSGNAATATKLQTARTIGISDGVTGTATSFNGSGNISIPVTSVKEAYLTWGGKALSGSISPLDMATSNVHSANWLVFSRPAGITIEYSRDGSTYSTYSTNDSAKIALVSGNGTAYYIGSRSSGNTVNDKLRITLNAYDMSVYTQTQKLLINISTNYATGSNVLVEYATLGAPTSFTTLGTYNIAGWSGWNSIPINIGTFGGGSNQTSNKNVIRLTFGITGINSDTTKSSALTVQDIALYGGTYWQFPSTMSKTGHLYSYDTAQNATFPKNVTATTFIGSLNGNADTATKLATARTIQTNLASTSTASFDGSANVTPGVTGVLGAANGGTGKTTLKDACNSLINALDTGPNTPVDADYYISQYVGGGTTTTTYYRRPMSALYSYIQGKTDSRYLKLSGGTMTGDITMNGDETQLLKIGTSSSWISGRDRALIRLTTYNAYSAISSMKTTNGSWDMGVYTNDWMYFTYCPDAKYNAGDNTGYTQIRISPAGGLYGAVWNDYAEFRICNEDFSPGQVVLENGNDTLSIASQRLQRGCSIISDTFGFAIGETDEAKCPIAVSGRVLAYGYESREEFKKHIGWPVCSGPNGTVSIMTEEEEEKYPSRIIGTISAVPDYETWGTGNVEVNNRIWIKVK